MHPAEGRGFYNDDKVERIEARIREEIEGIREDLAIIRKASALIRHRELIGDLVELGQVLTDPGKEPAVDSFAVQLAGSIAALETIQRARQDIEIRLRRIHALDRIRRMEIERRGKRVYPFPGESGR